MALAACDGVMECDSVVLLSEGQGEHKVSRVNAEGTLQFEFPEGKRPNVKVGPHEMSIIPWLKQAEKGKCHPPSETDAPGCGEKIYKKYVAGGINRMLEGENIVITSFGDEKTRKVPLIFGDGGKGKGVLQCFFEELFQNKDAVEHHISLTAYSFNTFSENVTDLTCPAGESKASLRDADAKRAGTDIIGLQACEITSTDTAIKEIDHMRKMVQRLRDLEMERVELRAEELSLKSKNTNTEGDVVIDLDDFESVSSPQRKKDAAVSSYIPEPFYDEVLFVSVSIHSGDVSAIQKRSSSEWCSANFVVLPDNSRPECVGALSQDDVKRYEKVQRLVCCMLAILTAIRLKRRRVPFLSHKWTSTLRSAYRQTGEKEDETKVMKSASFRKSADTPDSPKMKKASEAAPTRSIVLMNLCSKGDEILELFHSFTCAKRFVEMGTSATGMFTRHLQVEQAQMDREIASLILQLKVAQEMHQYRPMLFGVKKKGSEDKSIKEREQDALEKKKTIIETQKEERRSRIQSAAQHIADRNIHEEMARLAVVQQQYDDKKAKHDKVKAELRKWQNMSTEHLVQEINTETDQLRSTEKKVQALELGKKRLKSEIETSERGLADMHKQMKDNQRKALQELEAKQHAARDFIENRKKMARSRMDEMRAEIEYAGNLILEKAADLLSATQSRGHSAGTEAVDEAKLVQENLSASVKGLHQILPRILPSDVPSSEMQKRIATVRDKILANASHELLSLQSELSTAGIPLPIAASTHEAVRAGPLVSIHITVLGVSGLLKNRKNSKYSVAHQWRGGGVAETARVPLKDETGVVEFKHLFKVAHRLPAEKKEIGTAVALETFAVVEFLPDGSFSEALPFDIDLNAFACRAKQIYHIVPGAKSNVSVAIEVTTKKMKLREPQANPLHTVTSLHAVKITDDYGPSSDEGE